MVRARAMQGGAVLTRRGGERVGAHTGGCSRGKVTGYVRGGREGGRVEGGREREREGAREGHEGCLTVGSEAGKQGARSEGVNGEGVNHAGREAKGDREAGRGKEGGKKERRGMVGEAGRIRCGERRCRYLAIFFPKTSKMTARTAVFVIAGIWLVPLCIFSPWPVVYTQKTFNVSGHAFVACTADWRSARNRRLFTLGAVFLSCYLVPLLFVASFYALIGVRVWRRHVRGMRHGDAAQRHIHRAKVTGYHPG